MEILWKESRKPRTKIYLFIMTQLVIELKYNYCLSDSYSDELPYYWLQYDNKKNDKQTVDLILFLFRNFVTKQKILYKYILLLIIS